MPEPPASSSPAPGRSHALLYCGCIYPACVACISLPITWCAAAVFGIGLWPALEIGYAALLMFSMTMLLMFSLAENKSGKAACDPSAVVRCSLRGFGVQACVSGLVIPPLLIYVLVAGLPAYLVSLAVYKCLYRRRCARNAA